MLQARSEPNSVQPSADEPQKSAFLKFDPSVGSHQDEPQVTIRSNAFLCVTRSVPLFRVCTD